MIGFEIGFGEFFVFLRFSFINELLYFSDLFYGARGRGLWWCGHMGVLVQNLKAVFFK